MKKHKEKLLKDVFNDFSLSSQFEQIKAQEEQSDAWRFQLGFIKGLGSYLLIWLFELFETKQFVPKDSSLENDIKKSIETILKIEDIEKKRKKRYLETEATKQKEAGKEYTKQKSKMKLSQQKYRSYFILYINDIDSILRKYPINIGLTSEQYLMPPSFSLTKLFKESYPAGESFRLRFKKIKNLKKQKSLPNLRHYLFGLDASGVNLSDEKARFYLTCGLFDYSQRLIHGNFERPRKCLYCARWFLASRRNHLFCTIKCKDFWYGKTVEGKKVRARASRRWRWLKNHPEERIL